MGRYSCDWIVREGEQICQLRDKEAECIVEMAVTCGMNVIRCTIRDEEIILPPPSLAELRNYPFRYGIPILCPPGRTSNGIWRHRGQRYELPLNSGPHNMHGTLGAAPWKVIRCGADVENGAVIEASYDFFNEWEEQRHSGDPLQLSLTLTYRLKAGQLSLEGAATAIHSGVHPVPLALGFHPYFKVNRATTMLQIPNGAQWPMNREGAISGLPECTELAERIGRGMALGELQGSLHFFQLEAGDSVGMPYVCRMLDKESGRRIAFHIDSLFSKLALFVPTWGEAISLEPHSCVPDAFHLPFEPTLTGVRELIPGEKLTFGWKISVEQALENEVQR